MGLCLAAADPRVVSVPMSTFDPPSRQLRVRHRRHCDAANRSGHEGPSASLADPKCDTSCRKALESLLELWAGLTRFVDDSRIPMDNNASGRQNRGPALGSKSYYGTGALRCKCLAAMLFPICHPRAVQHQRPQVADLVSAELCSKRRPSSCGHWSVLALGRVQREPPRHGSSSRRQFLIASLPKQILSHIGPDSPSPSQYLSHRAQ